ncbi:MAG TPA: aa3-type cytochrome c oxidase subunit IV [Rhodobacteraceae bacterium]|nr:aa3-type cytochrome c oxidase subunit IV [Paracoccaceae bacterium]
MTEFEHGTMDTKAQEKTFNGFIKFVAYALVGILVFLFLLGLVNG